MSELTTFEKEAIRLALVRMFRAGGHFDICVVRDMCSLAGVIPPQRTMDALHTLHCVNWSEMTPAMRDETAKVVLGLFDHAGFDLPTLAESFFPAPPDKPVIRASGFLARLLPKGQPS